MILTPSTTTLFKCETTRWCLKYAENIVVLRELYIQYNDGDDD